MSTRRARIKAVASLPVRRKPTSNAEPPKTTSLSPKQEKNSETTDQETPSDLDQTKTLVNQTEGANVPEVPQENNELLAPSTPRLNRISSPVISSPIRKQSPLVKPIPSPVLHAIRASQSNLVKYHSPAKPTAATNVPNPADQLPKPSIAPIQNKPTEAIDGITDFNPPSVPESIDSVLDGIVPLQLPNVHKPLDPIKDQIISENAEVLFDPIVPLPSPGKVRLKLRPAPRLPFRRNSVQGSASESEDESRRILLSSGGTTPGLTRQRHDSHTLPIAQPIHPTVNREISRVRNDSVSSVISNATTLGQSGTLNKEKHSTKSRRTEMSRRAAALRRKFRGAGSVSRDKLTMYDLIFYNPTGKPIVHNEDESLSKIKTVNTEPVETAPEKQVIEPEETSEPAVAAPVPQIKIGPNGQIILDEKSLVIEQTESSRKLSNSVVLETNGGNGKYSRSKRSTDWNDAETVRFYRALAAVGTDFSLMIPLFPDRTRKELKVKFKKEERNNGAQVDKALRSQIRWDAVSLVAEFAEERKLAIEKAKREKELLLEQKRAEKERLKAIREEGLKASIAARAIESSVHRPRRMANSTDPTKANTADEIIQRALSVRGQRKRTTKPETSRPVNVPQNMEPGSLVVLTVNDPNEPTKKMLQTYVAQGGGRLTPVALPPTLLNSVVGYMKKGTPSTSSSPQISSPGSLESSRSTVIRLNPSPTKRIRHNSYNITQL